MKSLTRLLIVLALVAAACGGDTTAETTTSSTATTTSTSTTAAPTTTTTVAESTTTTTDAESTTVTTYPAAFASPLNGLPAQDETALDRRAVAVKVDNHAKARPQSGLMDADLVVETRVEAGLTRFIAFFHDNDTDYVGPIRSVRPTDATIAAAVGAPITISGGQPWVQARVAGEGVGLVGPGAARLFRITQKVAPHNLYGSTTDMRAGADLQGYSDTPPRPLYTIDEWDYPEGTATTITLDWSDAVTVRWVYEDGVYSRLQDGVPHEVIARDGTRSQIQAEVLVVLGGEFYTVSAPDGGSSVPAIDTAGTGPAWVFSRGRVWQGVWERAKHTDPFVLKNADGTTAVVPAGFAWVSVFPKHRSITWS